MGPNDHVAPWTGMHKLPIKTCFSELHHSIAHLVPESIHAESKETRKEATEQAKCPSHLLDAAVNHGDHVHVAILAFDVSRIFSQGVAS